jgi:hypothetical protein
MSFESTECLGEVLNTSRNTPFAVLHIAISDLCVWGGRRNKRLTEPEKLSVARYWTDWCACACVCVCVCVCVERGPVAVRVNGTLQNKFANRTQTSVYGLLTHFWELNRLKVCIGGRERVKTYIITTICKLRFEGKTTGMSV